MDFQELLKQKEIELQKLLNEYQRHEQRRNDLLSQILKLQGAIETLQQLNNDKTEVKNE